MERKFSLSDRGDGRSKNRKGALLLGFFSLLCSKLGEDKAPLAPLLPPSLQDCRKRGAIASTPSFWPKS